MYSNLDGGPLGTDARLNDCTHPIAKQFNAFRCARKKRAGWVMPRYAS